MLWDYWIYLNLGNGERYYEVQLLWIGLLLFPLHDRPMWMDLKLLQLCDPPSKTIEGIPDRQIRTWLPAPLQKKTTKRCRKGQRSRTLVMSLVVACGLMREGQGYLLSSKVWRVIRKVKRVFGRLSWRTLMWISLRKGALMQYVGPCGQLSG